MCKSNVLSFKDKDILWLKIDYEIITLDASRLIIALRVCQNRDYRRDRINAALDFLLALL